MKAGVQEGDRIVKVGIPESLPRIPKSLLRIPRKIPAFQPLSQIPFRAFPGQWDDGDQQLPPGSGEVDQV